MEDTINSGLIANGVVVVEVERLAVVVREFAGIEIELNIAAGESDRSEGVINNCSATVGFCREREPVLKLCGAREACVA